MGDSRRARMGLSFLMVLAAWVVLSGRAAGQTTGRNIQVVVNQALYDSGAIGANLDRYLDDLHRDGWNPTVTLFDYDYASTGAVRMTRAVDLRNHLIGAYNSPGGLAGAVFVGEMPEAVWNHSEDYYTSEFRTDLFFMDMDGAWTHTATKLTNAASSGLAAEIFVGRIQAHNSSVKYVADPDPSLPDSHTDPATWMVRTEAEGINAYLDKNHAYRERQADFVVGGGTGAALDYDVLYSGSFYSELAIADGATVEVVTDPDADKADFISRTASNEYELLSLRCHSLWHSPNLTGGRLYNYLVTNPDDPNDRVDPQAMFYYLNTCLPGSYQRVGYFSGELLYGTSMALAVVSHSKSVANDYGRAFYETLGEGDYGLGDGETVGEALRAWVRDVLDGGGSIWGATQVGGANLQGDPTLWMQHSTAYRMVWARGEGGAFSDAAAWLDGSLTSFRDGTGLRVHDTAVFDLDSPDGYVVTVPGGSTLNRVVVADDTVELSVAAGETLTLTSASPIYPGLIVGEQPDDVASLTITNGTVLSQTVHVGWANGSTAELIVGEAGVLQSQSVAVGPGGRFAVAAGGTLAPGMSPGTMTVLGDLLLEDGAILDWECSAEGMDLLDVRGNVILPEFLTIHLTDLDGGGLPDQITLLTFATRSGADDLSGWTIEGMDGARAWIEGTTLVVPEPATLGLLALAAPALLRRRRRPRAKRA